MSKLRGAIIGFGNIAEKGHWPTYAATSDVEMVAMMDPSPARQSAAKVLSPTIRCYTSVDDLWRAEKLDFVDICTPPASHTPLALQALEHDCHVLCEKPLTLSETDYGALAEASKKQDRVVFTVLNWAHAPIYQKAFSLIRDGRIGPVWRADFFTLRNSHCKGVGSGADVAGGASEDWRKNSLLAGGGILIDHGWHSFYLLMNLMGAEPERLTAVLRMGSGGLEEVAETLVQFPQASGSIFLTWRSPVRRNSAFIQGEKGTLLLDDDRLLLVATDGARDEYRFETPLSAGSHHADWFTSIWAQFLGEITDRQVRGQNFRQAGWCLALTTAAYASGRQGVSDRPVVFPPPTAALVSR